MAITVRSASSGSSNTAASTQAITLPTGWAAGDLILVVAATRTVNSTTFSQSAGTGTWTFQSTGDHVATTPGVQAMAAWRVMDGTETAPTFTSTTTNSWAWAAICLTPDAGSTISIDAWASVLVDATGATTHTPNAATPAAAGDVSVIIAGYTAAATGATAFTLTEPTGWTEPANGFTQTTGSGTTASHGASVSANTAVSGSPIAPGALTTSVSTLAVVYHALVTETAPIGPPQVPPQPGGKTWRRIHRKRQTPFPPMGDLTPQAAVPGNQPGGLIASRSARQYSRAVTGGSVTAGGNAGPPPPPPVVAAAGAPQLPVAARRYPPRAVFRGLAAPPLRPLPPRPPPPPVAVRPLAQRPRALVAFRPVATTNAVPPRGAQPGGLVRRRGPARAVVAFRPVATINAHGPAGALPGTGLVRARPAGQIHRVVWAGTTVRTTNNVAVPRGTVPPRPAVARRAPARALIGFTPVATVNASGPAGAVQPRAAVPVPRRVAARGLWQRVIGPANAHGGIGAQPGTGLVRRRAAARAFVAFRPVRTVNNTLIPPGTVQPKPVVARRTAARAVVAFRPVRTTNAPPTVSAAVTGGLIARRHPKQVSRSRLGVGIGGSGVDVTPRAAQPVTGGVTARRHPKQVSRARTGLGVGGAGVDAAARLPQPATGTGLVRRRIAARAVVAFRPVRTVNAVPPRGSVQPKPVIGRRYPARAYVAFRPVRTTPPLFSIGTLTAATAATATQTPAAAPAGTLTAATGPSSAITATTQKTGGPS